MATNTSHKVFFAQIENVSLCECWTWLWRRLVVGWAISSAESYRLKQQRALYMIANSEQQMAPLLIDTSYRICIFLFFGGKCFWGIAIIWWPDQFKHEDLTVREGGGVLASIEINRAPLAFLNVQTTLTLSMRIIPQSINWNTEHW